MRWRVLAAVLFVMACSYGLVWGLGYARTRLRGVARTIAEQVEISTQPRFEVARGTRTLPAHSDKRFRVENSAGSVQVRPGGPGLAVKYAIIAPGRDEAEARRRAASVRVRADRDPDTGDRIWVTAAGGKRLPPGVTVDLIVYAAPDSELSVKAVSASVEVTGMQGDVTAQSVSGEVNINSSARSAMAHTISGSISIVGAQGKTEARSTSGSVNLANLHSNDIAARTVSGSIEIEVTDPFAGQLEAASVSGELAVSLPRSSSFEAHATSVSGGISGEAWQGSVGRKSYARLASGRGSVTLSTTSGSIDLTLTD